MRTDIGLPGARHHRHVERGIGNDRADVFDEGLLARPVEKTGNMPDAFWQDLHRKAYSSPSKAAGTP